MALFGMCLRELLIGNCLLNWFVSVQFVCIRYYVCWLGWMDVSWLLLLTLFCLFDWFVCIAYRRCVFDLIALVFRFCNGCLIVCCLIRCFVI